MTEENSSIHINSDRNENKFQLKTETNDMKIQLKY